MWNWFNFTFGKSAMSVQQVNNPSGNSSSYEESEQDCDEHFILNGLVLSKKLIPEEVLIIIISFVPWVDLPSCRLVCQSWKGLIDSAVSYEKLKGGNLKNIVSKQVDSDLMPNFASFPFYLNFAIGIRPKVRFGANLLKNVFGLENPDKFKYWTVDAVGGDGWAVESPPQGCNPLPEEVQGTSCFVTSFHMCHKSQLISLEERGLNSKIMDEIQPDIEISEWYAARFDCGIKYFIKVSLLDSKKEPITIFRDRKKLKPDMEWYKISHTFRNYGPGVRYVLYKHGGMDTQFWAGHYGSKMAGASVVALLPKRILEDAPQHN